MLTRYAVIVCALTTVAAGLYIVNQTAPRADAHCQVPCGIYDDPARIKQMYEDAATITKAMNEMAKVAGAHDAQSHQQFVRWTHTKEQHASNIIAVVSEYFLTQKLKPVLPGNAGYEQYLVNLAAHHTTLVAAMNCKQNADPAHAAKLNDAIHVLEHIWDPTHQD